MIIAQFRLRLRGRQGMEMYPYWRRQDKQALFPEIEWSKPERRDQAGKLLIIGGSTGNFRAVALAYETALKAGIGEVKVLVPDSLKKMIPPVITDVIFAPSNISGGFSMEAEADFMAAASWTDSILLIGDTNKNSETAVLFEALLKKTEKLTIITRDAVDILMNSFTELLDRENTIIISSFAQTQKIFQTVFYPKILTFSMQLTNLAETLHKFTITYPILIGTLHAENFILSENGEIITTPLANSFSNNLNPLKIWSGEIPTKIAVYATWSQSKKLAASTSAIIV